ncbi:riboflavin synthase [Virgibacillus natechei]|uniref:Riboflavin synthase n=1 Tax=Virgibacillus natechei TaxID=1216297 RepID=A0ABS4IIA7_9BACI|nr:riboflavin synthase [Virgibacillus natechei]MBP1970650.1 riboflavin synthase [Virgibacillus natechei]UZD13964.1 riboflavin synthase [Virgibacillus natechei]
MFTGIIEEMGTVKSMEHVSDQAIQMVIGSEKVLSDINTGDSISVNGICLTVTDFNSESFHVDVMPETIKSTSLNALESGSKVNLERSMAANGRFGGHFVSGHVDGTGEIVRKERQENAIYYDIQLSKELYPFLLNKGSVSVDGISLTIFNVAEDIFTISLIPHTVSETILGEKSTGDIVNIECDMLAKYVQQMIANK